LKGATDAEKHKWGALWPHPAPGILFRIDPVHKQAYDGRYEDQGGIKVRHHVQVQYLHKPHLWKVFKMWQKGIGKRALTPADWKHLTNFEVECFEVLRDAHDRQLARRKAWLAEDNESGEDG
jgi:hypothetical protein